MRVYWTPEAVARLHDIETHIAEESPLVAKQVAQRMFTCFCHMQLLR